MNDIKTIFEFEDGRELTNPSFEEVLSAIDRVDGLQETYGALFKTGIGRLVLGGGQNGRWLVYYEPEGDNATEFPILLDESKNNSDIKLIICGVASDYPAAKTVGKDKVIKAFKHFYETGGMLTDFQWSGK